MEEFIIGGKPVLVLGNDDIKNEIAKAALDRREANFSGKTIKSLSLSEKDLDHGINLENALITGNVFLADTAVGGDINMANAVVDGSFFFGRGKLMGDLILEKAWIGQTINMVGLNITGSLKFGEARVNGFVSLTKAVVLGDIDFRKIEVRNYSHGDLKIKGDIFFKSAQINGSLYLDQSIITGNINLDGALIRRNLSAKNLNIEGSLSLLNSIYPLDLADFAGTPPEKINR